MVGPKNKLEKKKKNKKKKILKKKTNSPIQFLVYFSRCVSCIYKYINSSVLFLKNKWNHAIHNSSVLYFTLRISEFHIVHASFYPVVPLVCNLPGPLLMDLLVSNPFPIRRIVAVNIFVPISFCILINPCIPQMFPEHL